MCDSSLDQIIFFLKNQTKAAAVICLLGKTIVLVDHLVLIKTCRQMYAQQNSWNPIVLHICWKLLLSTAGMEGIFLARSGHLWLDCQLGKLLHTISSSPQGFYSLHHHTLTSKWCMARLQTNFFHHRYWTVLKKKKKKTVSKHFQRDGILIFNCCLKVLTFTFTFISNQQTESATILLDYLPTVINQKL